MSDTGALFATESLFASHIQMDEWLALYASRDEFADEYASLLHHNGTAWDGWKPINEAIVRRWSMSALAYIKTRAWKIATQNL